MVFCKSCKQKVDDCPHFVEPIQAPRTIVYDEKVASLAYAERERILEISYRNGQTWQLSPVPPAMAQEIKDTTLWSFIKFIAQRYKANPVRTPKKTADVPASQECWKCKSTMTISHRINDPFEPKARVLWQCTSCTHHEWKQYEGNTKRAGVK
jgi:hypothetical protein